MHIVHLPVLVFIINTIITIPNGIMIASAANSTHSFTVDYVNHRFLLDGQPFQYISGTLHYFRMHPGLWKDRLKKVRAAGLNAIQTYIPWNWHETYKGQYEFTGQKNVIRFIEMAREVGLYVLVQLGPYTCAEIENGALPWWLIKTKDIRMRTMDPRFLNEVRTWYSILLPKLVPLLHKNGGPILMVQPENEYSFFGCDMKYRLWLRDEIRTYFGNDTLQYTIDPPNLVTMKCGIIPETLPTADFWPGSPEQMNKSLAVQRFYSKGGPYVNSEFYTGWFDMWGGKTRQSIPGKALVDALSYLYSVGASINIYAIHGGTIPGFFNGANEDPAASITTSYDFAAPISEAGDCNEKFVAIRNWIQTIPEWKWKPASQIPKLQKKIAYGKVAVNRFGSDLQALTSNTNCKSSRFPLTFEDIDHPYGFVLYDTVLKFNGQNLSVPGIKDRGYVVLDGKFQGTLVSAFYNYTRHWLPVNAVIGQRLFIMVENQGRQHFETINDFKGIIKNVTLDGQILSDWNQCGVDFSRIYEQMESSRKMQQNLARENTLTTEITGFIPGIYIGYFTARRLADTFFDPTGWGKGVLFVNGVNMGRYWPTAGPQVTLFIPKPVLKKLNTVMLLELEQAGSCSTGRNCTVNFIDRPIFHYSE